MFNERHTHKKYEQWQKSQPTMNKEGHTNRDGQQKNSKVLQFSYSHNADV
jgi:hypothetical protein